MGVGRRAGGEAALFLQVLFSDSKQAVGPSVPTLADQAIGVLLSSLAMAKEDAQLEMFLVAGEV